jgi:hypothetical protein
MPPALVEGTETIVLYGVLVAAPAWAWTAAGMAALVAVNVVQRLRWSVRSL